MALTNDQITAQNFKDFYGQIRPYLNGTAHGGFTPIGTVISVMGKQAPHNYLICDGTVYNIADYPELAAYFAGQFEASNFFGGDGITTFAVPDLRGEFLRGTGTNSHTNTALGVAEGSGADVGVHQESTSIPSVYGSDAGATILARKKNSSVGIVAKNADAVLKSTVYAKVSSTNDTGASNAQAGLTIRPTNTSVLYCIATKNIFMDAGCNYSTDEIVVGTWIDNKTIYQRTLSVTVPKNTSSYKYDIRSNIPNCDGIVKYDVNVYAPPGTGEVFFYTLNYKNSISTTTGAEFKGDNKRGRNSTYPLLLEFSNTFESIAATFYVTVRYTKTTD